MKWFYLALVVVSALFMPLPAGGAGQELKAETNRDFECYAQKAEARMDGAGAPFLLAEGDSALNDKLVRGRQIVTVPGDKTNPHKVFGAMLNDWVGSVFVPGGKVEQVVRMLQDYDHREKYFSEMLTSSKLLCRTGENRFGFTMLLKEPSVIEMENDVVWEKLDPQRWKCRSYSTKVQERGKQHRYLLRLNSYWRFKGVPEGVYIQGQNISLGGEVGALTRSIGSMIGLSPEKSLRKSLTSMKETLQRKDLIFELPAAGRQACGGSVPRPACGGTVTDNE